MLEILYRIYEVADEETARANRIQSGELGLWSTSKAENIELVMDCMVCDSRDQFKEAIRATYGESIPFRYTRKLNPGDVYCIIIAEHAYNVERYFNKIEFTCANCHSKVTTYLHHPIKLSKYDIPDSIYANEEYRTAQFCSNACKHEYIQYLKATTFPDGTGHMFITRDMFAESTIAGYIYLITKKSTGEFYVGQTKYAPIFRWGEHLKTERFAISGILDYKFEVLEVVPITESILERERYWIHTMYSENAEKCLNVASVPKTHS